LYTGLLLPGEVESCCTIVAETAARVITWDRTELVELMERYPGVRRSLKAVLSWDIVRKLKAQRGLLSKGAIDDPEKWTERRNRQTFHRYAAILHTLLAHPEYLAGRRRELDKYRMIHHIDDEHHNMALREVGWTPEEFEAGRLEGSGFWSGTNADGEGIVKHDFRWYANDLLVRIFG
jgi:hypothetical protein